MVTKQEKVLEHLIELFEQSRDDTPEQLAKATLWVLNEDNVVLKVADVTQDLNGHYQPAIVAVERLIEEVK